MAKNLHRQRTPMSEQLRLITECRQSGLTDADWCRENGVNPSTFYSWLARCRKSACSAQIPPAGYGHSARPEPRQDVVAIELVPDQLPESAAVPLPDQPETHLDNSQKNLPDRMLRRGAESAIPCAPKGCPSVTRCSISALRNTGFSA